LVKYLIFLVAFFAIGFSSTAQNQPYCRLQGAVYETPTKQGADFWVFEEESEAFADMLIYEEENKLYADQPGMWFFVENIGLADFAIYFTKDKSEADFVVCFTESPTFAGCQ